MAKLAFLIPIFPLLGFILNALFGRHFKRPTSGIIACLSVGLSFLFALILFGVLQFDHSPRIFHFFEWIHVGSFQVNYAFHVDHLTLVMALVVTFVGGLIHIYSLEYMKHDVDYSRYFAFLNLFTAMMLILVMAENLLLMFIGWEGVGLCSYLLIGFWFEKPSASDAGRKAFVVNRIGDAAFIIGMLLIFNHFSTLSIKPILDSAPELFTYGSVALTAITILLFIGATGKSAQFPLHVWLPDAMEGPTPVSALIHAATMVTAGVYMVARLNMLFLMTPVTLWIIGIIAAITTFGAAIVAFTQYDIKRVLAYSTISQLGYMFIALSAGAFGSAIFHLVTHAFFKALLFLAAGAIIHSLKNETDMRRMGGLSRAMPVTWIVFLIGALSLSGFPFLAGFFSKDLIIESTFTSAAFRKIPFGVIGYFTTTLTAFYIFRLYYRVFRGRYSGPSGVEPHDVKPVMSYPMGILAFFSVFIGFLGWPAANAFARFLSPVFDSNTERVFHHLGESVEHHYHIPWDYWLISTLFFILGWAIAYLFFVVAPEARATWVSAYPRFWNMLKNKFYVDDVYNNGIVAPGKSLFKAIWLEVDLGLIDALINGIGYAALSFGRTFSRLTSGYVRNYALYVVVGVVIILYLALR